MSWYSCCASRLSGSSTVTIALAADECSSATQPPSAPHASESRTSAISRGRSEGGGGAARGRGGRSGADLLDLVLAELDQGGRQRLESHRAQERGAVAGGDHPAQ